MSINGKEKLNKSMMQNKDITDVFIYGAGNFGNALATELEKQSINYQFIDAYAERDSIPGKYIYRPNEIDINDKASLVVYLTVFLAPVQKGVDLLLTQNLEQMDFKKVISTDQTMELFPQALKNLSNDGFLWRQSNAPEYFNSADFDLVMGYLSDDRSRELLDNISQFRQNCTFANYIRPDYGPEYEPNGIDLSSGLNQLHIVDCGAFTGDTVNQFFNLYGERIRTYYAFEPDITNYQQLLKVTNKVKQEYPSSNIICQPCGVSDSIQVKRFSSGLSEASHITSNGDSAVYTIRLDETLLNSSVNLIKIDVEGEDLAVLKGAEKLISQQKPNLAVSCYHRPDHIWQVPKFLKNVNSDYELFLRQHGHWGLELTIYCIDKSRL